MCIRDSYWLGNNFWTLGQQYVVYRRIDREEAQQAGSAAVVDSTATEATATGATVAESTVTEATVAGTTEVESAAVSSTTSRSGTAGDDKRDETPGLIEDNGRDTDEPDQVR